MKQKYFNLICIMIALLSGILTFVLKYHVLEKEKILKQIYIDIKRNKREMHGLQTDWAALTNPENLRLQAGQTSVQPIRAKQIIQSDQLHERPMPLPVKKPNFEGGSDAF